jgi:hypothetical protein
MSLLIAAIVLGHGLNKGLQVQLQSMVKIDQGCREQFVATMKQPPGPAMLDVVRKMNSIDRENTGKLNQMVLTYGWPTVSMVGKEGAKNAWLLVQHADANPLFQRKCLDLMTSLLQQNEVDKRNYAYLVDRVLVAEGKPQRYGSQFEKGPDGNWRPKTIEDPENVDKRRAEMGMETLAEYRKLIEQAYGAKPPGP